MKIIILTVEEKDKLVGGELQPNWTYNPVLNNNNQWFITEEEVKNTTNKDFEWVKKLKSIDYNPI